MFLSEEEKEFLRSNIGCVNYSYMPLDYTDYYNIDIDWDNLKEYQISDLPHDLEIIRKRRKERYQFDKMAVGDYLIRKDGTKSRITYIWPDGHVQDGGGRGSFHMFKSGTSDYSGSLDSCDKDAKFTRLRNKELANFWCFSRDDAKGSNGMHFQCFVNVWQEI